jgi:hypothetical protein
MNSRRALLCAVLLPLLFAGCSDDGGYFTGPVPAVRGGAAPSGAIVVSDGCVAALQAFRDALPGLGLGQYQTEQAYGVLNAIAAGEPDAMEQFNSLMNRIKKAGQATPALNDLVRGVRGQCGIRN